MRRVGLLIVLLAARLPEAQPIVVRYPQTTRPPARWTIDPRPLLEIGGQDGTGPTEFTNIVGVGRQSTGALIVADGATNELRAFEARGRFVKRWTRLGRGPGELLALDGISMEGDSVVVVEGRQAVHLFAPDGERLRSLMLPPVPGFIANPVFGSMSSFDAMLRLRAGSLEQLASVRQDSIWFARVSLRDSGVRVLAAERLGPTFPLSPGRTRYALGFGAAPLVVARTGRMCVAFSARVRVTCMDSLGRAAFILEHEVARRAVTDSARRAYRAVTSGRRPDGTSRFAGGLREFREQVARESQFADVYLAMSQLLLAHTGELWVRHYATEDGFEASRWRSNTAASAWSIYDGAGRWVADCVLPPRFAPADRGADWGVGVSRDADDVERVSVCRLRR